MDILVMYTKPQDIIEEGKDTPGGWASIGVVSGHLLELSHRCFPELLVSDAERSF